MYGAWHEIVSTSSWDNHLIFSKNQPPEKLVKILQKWLHNRQFFSEQKYPYSEYRQEKYNMLLNDYENNEVSNYTMTSTNSLFKKI